MTRLTISSENRMSIEDSRLALQEPYEKYTLWTPSGITTEAWYDPSDTSTITSSGNLVSQVDDKSGNSRHLEQSVQDSKPITNGRNIGGLNVICCSADKWMYYNDFSVPSGDVAVFQVGVIDLIDNADDSIYSMFGGVYSDFETMTAGTIDLTGSTSPTLTELDAQTDEGSWSFYAGRGEGFIRTDADPADDTALEISTTDTGGLSDWAGRLDFDDTTTTIADVETKIKFTTATKRSTGFTRDVFWYICDGTTKLLTFKLDDGVIYLDGTSFGTLGGAADSFSVNPWDSTSQTAGYDNVWDVVIKIYTDGSLDVDWHGHTISKSAGYLSTSASVNRIEVNYRLTSGGHGVYFSRVSAERTPTWQFSAGDNPPDFDGRIATAAGTNIDLSGGPFPGPSIYNANFDYTGDVVFNAYVDGTNRGSSTYDVQLDTSLNFQVFKNRSGIVYTPEGCFGEMIVTYDLSESTRQLIEGYLAHKWIGKSILPSDHPYREAPPYA